MSNNDLDAINKRLNEVFMSHPEISKLFNCNLGGSQVSYTYYSDGFTKNQYFYTSHKILHKGSLKYVAGIYRYLKTKNVYVPRKMVGFAKKWRAIEWAREASEYFRKIYMKEKENLNA